MGLWSDQCLPKAQRKVNSHHLNSFVEIQQLQRANGSHVNKMQCSAAPYHKTDRVCSFQEAAPTLPPSRKYYYSVFFHAEEVPLPESSGPEDLNESATWPRAVTQDAALANVCPLPHEVPLPPSPPPPQTMEKKYPDLSNVGFPSLDDEVAFFMSKPLSMMSCDVPLPPSPSPADTVHHMAHTPEKKYPDLKNIGFPSLDDDIESKCPKLLPHEVPLPPTPPPADAVLHMAHTPEKKYPDLSNVRFPSLDDEIVPEPLREMACVVPLPPNPPCIGLHSFHFISLAEDDELRRPNLLPHEIPLPPSPPPADAAPHVYTTEKTHLGLTGFPFFDVDTEIVPKPLSEMARVVPPPPTSPPAATVLHMAHITEKKYPDLRNIGFPSLDDQVACLMSKPLNIMACDVPLPPSPPLVETPHLAKKYLDLSFVAFPCLDDD